MLVISPCYISPEPAEPQNLTTVITDEKEQLVGGSRVPFRVIGFVWKHRWLGFGILCASQALFLNLTSVFPL